MSRIKHFFAATMIAGAALTGCGGPSRTISETTLEFPKCDTAQGKITLENLRCDRRQLCYDNAESLSGRAYGYMGGSPADFFARAKGVEGNTLSGLRGAHKKLTGMLENALRETGCFESVERLSPEKGQEADWRIGGDVNKIVAWADAALPSGYGSYSATHRTKQSASAEVTVDIQKSGAADVMSKRKFSVSAKRVGDLQVNTNRFDWSRKRDDEGFGDTAMQDVASEIMTEAAVFITEKLAGQRIVRRVPPPPTKSEGHTN
jgi:curli biogenesis system outer membrane secretion channel CsgG